MVRRRIPMQVRIPQPEIVSIQRRAALRQKTLPISFRCRRRSSATGLKRLPLLRQAAARHREVLRLAAATVVRRHAAVADTDSQSALLGAA